MGFFKNLFKTKIESIEIDLPQYMIDFVLKEFNFKKVTDITKRMPHLDTKEDLEGCIVAIYEDRKKVFYDPTEKECFKPAKGSWLNKLTDKQKRF